MPDDAAVPVADGEPDPPEVDPDAAADEVLATPLLQPVEAEVPPPSNGAFDVALVHGI